MDSGSLVHCACSRCGVHAKTLDNISALALTSSNTGNEKEGSRIATSSPGFATGKGRRITASTSVKTVVTAPSPQPRATSAASVRPGRLANCRTANRTSCRTESRAMPKALRKPCADPVGSSDGDRPLLVGTRLSGLFGCAQLRPSIGMTADLSDVAGGCVFCDRANDHDFLAMGDV